MVRVFFVLLLPLLLAAADLHIDHITVVGNSVQKMQAALSSVGIASVYGGPHIDHTTEMALVSFPDGSYLEFIALQSGAAPEMIDRHVWAKYLRGDAGPAAWALRAPGLAAEVARLKASGIPVSDPQRSGRDRPDGVHLEWETASVGPEPRGTFFPFLIHDFTPRSQRAFPQDHPVTQDFRGISGVVIAVRDLDASVKRFRQAYGLPEPLKQVDKQFGARLAMFGGTPVLLAQPLTTDTWLSQRIDRFGELPCAFLLAAANPARYQAASSTTWFGRKISWLDAEKLGWRLGFEPAR